MDFSLDRFRKLMKLFPQPLILAEHGGDIIESNGEAAELLEQEKENLSGENLEELLPDSENLNSVDPIRDFAEEDYSKKTYLLKKCGKIPVELRAGEVEVEGRERQLVIIRDLSEKEEDGWLESRGVEILRKFFDSTSDLVFLKDQDFSHLMANDSYADYLDADREEVIGKTDFELLPEDLANSCRKSDKRALRAGEPITVEERSGGRVFESRKFPVKLNGNSTGIGGIIRDVTKYKKAERALQEEREKLKSLHDAVEELQQKDTEEKITEAAVEVAEKILEFENCAISLVEGDYIVPKASSSGLDPDDTVKFKIGEGMTGATMEKGEAIWGADLSQYPEAKPENEELKAFISVPIGELGNFQIVSKEVGSFNESDVELAEILAGHLREELKKVRLEKELRQQAIRDPLTGLYNRRYFNEILGKEVEKCRRYGEILTFIMIDVNRFKEINDRYSHQLGDRVLKEVANLLEENVRDADTVVRYGGDEFLIMMPETDQGTEATETRLREKMARWNVESSLIDFELTLAMGSSHLAPGQDKDVEEILKTADRKMYEDKKNHPPR